MILWEGTLVDLTKMTERVQQIFIGAEQLAKAKEQQELKIKHNVFVLKPIQL